MAENSKAVEKAASMGADAEVGIEKRTVGSKKAGATGKKMRPKADASAEKEVKEEMKEATAKGEEKTTAKKTVAKKAAPKTAKRTATSKATKTLKKELDDVVAEKAEKAELSTITVEPGSEKTVAVMADVPKDSAPQTLKKAEPKARKTAEKASEKPAEIVAPKDETKKSEALPEAAEPAKEPTSQAEPVKEPAKAVDGAAKENAKAAQTEPATVAAAKTETTSAANQATQAAKQATPAQDANNLKKFAKKSASGGGSKAERRRRAKEAAAQALAQARAQDDGTKPETPKPQPRPEMEEELSAAQIAAEEARAAEMSKTLQVSLEQILAGVDEDEKTETGAPAEESAAEDSTVAAETHEPVMTVAPWKQRILDAMGEGALNLGKWIALVLVLVLLIALAEVAWLYHNATPDAISAYTVSFNDEKLTPSAYHWDVPVVGNLIKRSYKETLETEPQQLATMESTSIDLSINPSPSDATLVITDVAGNEVYNGEAAEVADEVFGDVGSYEGKLVLTQKSYANDDAAVTGNQTYLFSFETQPRPTVRLNTRSVPQGGVAALRITGVTDDKEPVITTDLDCGTITAVRNDSGWVAYLPIPREQERGEYFVKVKESGYTEDLKLSVTDKTWQYKDYSSAGQFTSPYVSLEDTPEEVQRVLSNKSGDVAWDSNGFVQPLTTSISVKLAYGTTEYAGRTSSQRVKGTGDGRVATSVVLGCNSGTSLIAPAAGKVLLARDLGGSAGNTVVIDHGAGVRSIFYNLRYIAVEAGDKVLRGQEFGTSNSTLIGEVRIGLVPVEPLSVWRSQCDALKYF